MDPKIYEILKRMKQAQKILSAAEFQVQERLKDLLVDMADLLVGLGEEAESQGKRAEEQALKITGLTNTLKIFTIVLILIGIVQIGLMAFPYLKSLFWLK